MGQQRTGDAYDNSDLGNPLCLPTPGFRMINLLGVPGR
jgi:hypothetical protein